MRFIYLLLITFVFTACGYHKIRFSKVDRKQKVVEINEISAMKKKSETVDSAENTVSQSVEESTYETETSSFSSTSETDETSSEESTSSQREALASLPETVQDSVELSKKEVDAIAQEALLAQRDGSISLFSGIMIYAFMILAIIALVAAFGSSTEAFFILAAVFGVGILVSLVLSVIFGIRSLRSRYNTPQGRKRAIVGLVLSSVYVALVLLNFVLGLL